MKRRLPGAQRGSSGSSSLGRCRVQGAGEERARCSCRHCQSGSHLRSADSEGRAAAGTCISSVAQRPSSRASVPKSIAPRLGLPQPALSLFKRGAYL